MESDEESCSLAEMVDNKADFPSAAFTTSLYELLKDTKNKGGAFVVSGELKAAPVCVIDIQDHGKVTFPIYDNVAKDIIPKLELAPFGKGTETAVDTAVRNSWQLDPTKFKIVNPTWDTFVEAKVLPLISRGFQLDNRRISAMLYKMLLYESGSFFKPHRDTEKAPGMFATLIIQLPSDYEGGTLVVKHDGKTKEIDFSSGTKCRKAFSNFFAALYCDCEHELLPVQNGYRTCLVYNLTWVNSESPPVAPIVSESEQNLIQLLKTWPLDALTKVVFVLAHKYSKAEISFKNLKSSDKAIALLLRRLVAEGSFELALGHFEKHDQGDADEENISYKRCRRDYDYEGDDNGYDSVTFLDDCVETDYEFSVVESVGGCLKNTGHLRLDVDLKHEVLPPDCFKGLDTPDKVEYEGYTGNCAGTLDHWYRLSALMIFPTANYFKVAKAGGFSQVLVLYKYFKMIAAAAEDAKKLDKINEDLLECLGNGPISFYNEQQGLKLLSTIANFGDVSLLQRYLSTFANFLPVLAPFLTSQCDLYGWNTFAPQLQLMMKSMRHHPAVELLETLSLDFKTASELKQNTITTTAEGLLDNCGEGPIAFDSEQQGIKLLSTIANFGNVPLLQRYLSTFAKFPPALAPFLTSQCDLYGWNTFAPQLQLMMKSMTRELAAELLETLSLDFETASELKQNTITAMAEGLLDCYGKGPIAFDSEQQGLKLLSIIANFGDVSLLQRYLSTFANFLPVLAPFLTSQCDSYGWDTFVPQLQLMMKSMPRQQAVELLQILSLDFKTASQIKQHAMTTMVKVLLDKEFSSKVEPTLAWCYRSYGYGSTSNTNTKVLSDKEFFTEMMKLCCRTNTDLVAAVQTRSIDQLLKLYGPACLDVDGEASQNPTLLKLVTHLMTCLQAHIVALNSTKLTMRRSEKIGCSCKDCQALQSFLVSGRQLQGFKMGEDRRTHLLQHINHMKGFTHETTRVGNPRTLVVTKTHVSQKATEVDGCTNLVSQLMSKFPSIPTTNVGASHSSVKAVTLR